MTLTNPVDADPSASVLPDDSERGAQNQWSAHAPAVARPDIARDLIDRAVAADRQWEFASTVTAAAPALSPYELLDAANTETLRRIVAQHGWPGFSLVGQPGSEAALRLALRVNEPHHDHEFVRTLLRLITSAAECGEATWAQWAHLQDRVSVLNGHDQQYGTQYRNSASLLEPELYPVADAQALASRRIAVGLAPTPRPQALPRPRT
ncbi:DUF6624 domain-containing protein [Streptomyces sp. S1D4-20]|uniref:DUF6624 domain-containing protein n=1 Tax=Streptomyces sp. S1D4-20 TaxID=2594462 RepID=UPI0011626CFD|nr:DUF6624 domain-containing protein [Streptomyces sp. S1D4-20]QDN54117.1 hypothetical protein FNV67_00620 [Streptomyces sp. S1D4-20]